MMQLAGPSYMVNSTGFQEPSNQLDLLPDVVFFLDLGGHIRFVNAAIQRYGYERALLEGLHVHELIHPPDRDHFGLEREERLLELRMLDARGEAFYVEVCMQGSDSGWQGVARDVSKRRMREEEFSRIHIELEKRVEEREVTLAETQRELVEKAHQAGVADIACSVLHSIDNVLNSVITSSQMIQQVADGHTFRNFQEANDLLENNLSRLDVFMQEDPRGKMLVDYYKLMATQATEDRELIRENAKDLVKKIVTIKNVITAQQNYALCDSFVETVPVDEVIDDALMILEAEFEKGRIEVTRQFTEVSPIKLQKTKLIHVLINVLNNAREAIVEHNGERRCIDISLGIEEQWLVIRVKDNGVGIEPDHIQRIFRHGFTTKKHGQGFGLHGCANAMFAMGGNLKVESPGRGQGATFILALPNRASYLEGSEPSTGASAIGEVI